MKQERSIGAVVFHDDEFLMLKYGLGHWGLVKGHVEEGESDEETIRRELEEETGITDAEIINGFEEEIHYFYKHEGRTISKTVTYLLIKVNSNEVRLSYEHTDYKWLPYEEALRLVTHASVKELIKKAMAFISSN